MAVLTRYGSSVLDTTLGTASKMASSTGGAETSKQTVFINSHIYGEIWSQGNASLSTVDAIPATPTGHGWIFYPGAGTFAAGNWSASITLACAVWGTGIQATLRFSKYTPGSGYTIIGSISAVSITGTAKTTYSFPATAMGTVTTTASDGIYCELWWKDNNLYAINDNPIVYESNSGTAGVASYMAITTSNFTAGGASTYTRALSSVSCALSGAALATKGNPYGVTVAVFNTNTYQYSDQLFPDCLDRGIGRIRIQQDWDLIENPKGTYDWTMLDDFVANCNVNDIFVQFPIRNPPAWADSVVVNPSQTNHTTCNTKWPNDRITNMEPSATAGFAAVLAHRYNGATIANPLKPGSYLFLDAIEIGNEDFDVKYDCNASTGAGYQGQECRLAKWYNQVVVAVAPVIRANSPSTQIGMFGSWWHDDYHRTTFLADMYNGVGVNGTNVVALLDFLNFHHYQDSDPYTDNNANDLSLEHVIANLQAVVKAHGDDTHFSVTEIGWSGREISGNAGDPTWATMATYWQEALEIMRTSGVVDFFNLFTMAYNPNGDSWPAGKSLTQPSGYSPHFQAPLNTIHDYAVAYPTWGAPVPQTTHTRALSGVTVSVGTVAASTHSDSFDRTVASGLGTASDGHTYTLSTGGGSGTWSCVNGQYAQLTNTTIWNYAQHGTDASLTDMDITFDWMSNYNAGPGAMVYFRSDAARDNCYCAGYQNGALRIIKWVANADTTLVSQTYAITVSSWYSCHVQVRGSTISMRCWARGTSEPTTWTISTNDSSYVSGYVGLCGYAGSVARVLSWDNLVISLQSGAPVSTTRALSGIAAVLSGKARGMPGQTWTGNVSNFIFGAHDHGQPGMSVPSPTTGMINSVKALGGPPMLLRTFFNTTATDAQIDQRINDIQRCGGIPLVCLQSPGDATFNKHVVTRLGSKCNIYEFGNEPDANNTPMPVGVLSAAWNAQVPAMRNINPNAIFFGPPCGSGYRNTFLNNCQASGVIPDGIAFHDYPCHLSGNTATCLTNTKSLFYNETIALRNAFASRWPNRDFYVGCTEWNVDWASPTVGWAQDQPFCNNFYKQALQNFIDAGADFACQFALFGGGNNYNMINDSNGGTTSYYDAFQYAVSALMPVSRARGIAGISASLGVSTLVPHARALVSVSATLKAFAGPRALLGVSIALKAFGVKRFLYNVSASVGVPSSAPVMAVALSGVYVPVQQAGISFEQRVDDRASGSFVTDDSAGQYPLQENQQAAISDTGQSLTLYRGFVEKVDYQRLGNSSTMRRTVTLKDLRALAEKRLVEEDFTGWTTGNLAAYLTGTYLSPEQIRANYALRRDHDASSFGQGTLSGVTSADGVLELARAGTDLIEIDEATADFADGNLSGVVAAQDSLQLASYTALKMAGIAGQNIGVNKGNYYTYWTIWAGTLTIQTGDYLEYSMWMSSSSADLVGGVDLLCSDRTALRDAHWPDQNGLDCHPGVHMQGWADDQWLYRRIPMPPSMIGKTIKTAMIALESDKEGAYCFYARGIRYKAATGATKATIFDTTLQRKTKVSNVGYYNITLKPVTVYEERGSRTTPAITLSSVGIAGESLLTWTASIPTQSDSTSSANEQEQAQPVTIAMSIDGGDTWQACTSGAALPSLPVGMDLTNRSLLLRQTLCIAGPDPERPPSLQTSALSLKAAYASPKVDVYRSYNGSEMSDGTNTRCTYQTAVNTGDGWQRNDVAGLKMSGWRKNWRTGEQHNQQTYGYLSASSGIQQGTLYLQAEVGGQCHVHLADAGTFDAIIIEADVCLHTASQAGLLYGTTYWGNDVDSWGYLACITPTNMSLYYGKNAATGTATLLATTSATFSADQWYHLKIVRGDDNIAHFSVDEVEYLTSSDARFTGYGGVGVRMWQSVGGSSGQAYFNNFGVSSNSALLDGQRDAPAISLSSAGSVGSSMIWWAEDVPSGCELIVSTSVNGGVSYQDCVNGGSIPTLDGGDSLSGLSLLVRTVLRSGSVSYTPALLGISWQVIGQFSASGSRTAPALDASFAGTVGSSSVTWNASVPESGTLFVDSSLNGTGWNTLLQSGDAVAGLTGQGDVWWDTFDSDTSANYTYTVGRWTWDILHSRLVTAGASSSDMTVNAWSSADQEALLITNQAHDFSLLLRYKDVSNRYTLVISDASGAWGPIIDLHRVASGVDTRLTGASIPSFTRGTYHVIRATITGAVITVWFDGAQLYTYTDASPISGAGAIGMNRGTGTSYLCNYGARPLGQDATGQDVYTRVRFTSTDPLTSPQVSDLVTCVRHPHIATGLIIPETRDWAYKQTIASALDEIASQSGFSWRFNESYQIVMQPRDGQFAPIVLATANGNIDSVTPPRLSKYSPKYRNRQHITGAVELVDWPESKVGNGVDTSWALTYPIDSIVRVALSGQGQSFGVKDKDTERMFYYTPGENTLSLDTAGSARPPVGRIDITYVARKPYRAMVEDRDQQGILAQLEGASGIYEASEDIGGLSSDAADALARARLAENGRLALNWSATTLQSGLAPGQLLTVVVPEYDLDDLQFFLTGVSTQLRMHGDDTLFYWYDIEATTGPSLGSWSRKLYAGLQKKGLM